MKHPLSSPRGLLAAGLLLAAFGCSDRELATGYDGGAAFAPAPVGPVVTTLADSWDGVCDDECSLRDAIETASTGQTITFLAGLTGSIDLSAGLLRVNSSITITGPGADVIALAPSDAGPIFEIAAGTTVAISGLTLRGSGHSFGVVRNYGNLTLSGMAVTGNLKYTPIQNEGTGAMLLEYSTVAGNDSRQFGNGGGITNHGTLTVRYSALTGNAGQFGGAISNVGTLTVSNSTISGNLATYQGGGIDNRRVAHISNVTITGNQAPNAGGLHSYLVEASGYAAHVKNTIIWGNTSDGTTPNDVASAWADDHFHSYGYNLVGAAGTGISFATDFAEATDQTGVANALLGDLALNAPGSTMTHALLEGSPALDAGACTDIAGATVPDDQRGVERPQGGTCDVGAYEGAGSGPPPSDFTHGCTYSINPKNGQRAVVVQWANATPGVTLVRVTDGRVVTKALAPTATGQWRTSVKSGVPQYELFGGTSRKDTGTVLVAPTACALAQ